MQGFICLKCKKEHDGSFGSGKFCCRKCANSRNFKEEINKTKKGICSICQNIIIINKRANIKVICSSCKELRKKEKYLFRIKGQKSNKRLVCNWCGELKKNCERKEICRSKSVAQLVRSLIKYFSFDKNVLGSKRFYQEFDRIKESLLKDYFENEMSTVDLQKKYNCLNQRVYKVLHFFTNGKLRSISEANHLVAKNGKFKKSYVYIKHKTWDNREIGLRSKLELDYVQKLDEQKIFYEVEKLRIPYWDSSAEKERIAICDFFIPSFNLLVEIKSTFILSQQLINLKDKVKAYKERGFNFKLILDKKEVDIDSLQIENFRA